MPLPITTLHGEAMTALRSNTLWLCRCLRGSAKKPVAGLLKAAQQALEGKMRESAAFCARSAAQAAAGAADALSLTD